jgi:hypothetical protein
LINSAKQVGSFAADIFGRKKLMHIIPLNAGRQIDRAGVAERAVFATRNSLNSQMVRNMKSPLSNPRARTAKLCGHSRPIGVRNYSIGKVCPLPGLR